MEKIKNNFNFKKFSVKHEKSAMKVGTDGVLLGAWCSAENAKTALDIGCGTGVIALMLAQRNTELEIDAVEIDKESANEAEENVQSSIFREQISIFCCSIQHFASNCVKKYDLIVSNPPFFINSLKCADKKRTLARHANTLPYDELIFSSKKLLNANGLFSVILPNEQCENFIFSAKKNGLFLVSQTEIFTTPASKCCRRLMTFSKNYSEKKIETLIIERSPNNFTDEYKQLTKDFYLKF